MHSLRENDARLARLMARLDDLGLLERTDVLLTSDHGFSTPGPPAGPGRDFHAALVAAGLKAGPGSDDVVNTGQGGGAITFDPRAAERAPGVVRWLLEQPWVGAVLARDGGPAAGLPGTLPLSLAWGGRVGPGPPICGSARLVGRPDSRNPRLHRRGAVQEGRRAPPAAGLAGATHGSASPYDMRNSLFAWGPRFKRGLRSDVPAGVVDVAPTVRHLLGLPAAAATAGCWRRPSPGGPMRPACRSPAAPTRGPCAGPAGASGSVCAGSPWRGPATWRGWTRSGPEPAPQQGHQRRYTPTRAIERVFYTVPSPGRWR